MSSSAPEPREHARPTGTSYVVLNADDRIVHVGCELLPMIGKWLGHVIWDHLPEAEAVYGPCVTEARATGRPVESLVYYNGRLKRLTAIPAPDGVALHVERLAELDLTTLGTLAASLGQIEAELAARASGPPGRRAHESLRALP